MAGVVEIFFDGLCEPVNPGGIACYGFIIKQNGIVLHTESGVIGNGKRMTNNVAEYTGLKKAAEWLVENHIEGNIIIKGDSQLVINQMNGSWSINSSTSRFFVPVIKSILSGRQIRFQWIPREENKEADILSEEAFNLYCSENSLNFVRCDCGGVFVPRTNNHTGGKFLGCNRYPKCRKTLMLDKTEKHVSTQIHIGEQYINDDCLNKE